MVRIPKRQREGAVGRATMGVASNMSAVRAARRVRIPNILLLSEECSSSVPGAINIVPAANVDATNQMELAERVLRETTEFGS